MSNELTTQAPTTYPTLQSALTLNNPSTFRGKLEIRTTHARATASSPSHDPIIDHLMTSQAFITAVWCLLASILAVGLAVVCVLILIRAHSQSAPTVRVVVLLYGGAPVLVAVVPLALMFALPFSRKLR